MAFWICDVLAVAGARPPYQRFVPEIEVYPQNFAVAEDQHGNVYIGNSDGVLLFDGKRWSLTSLPNGDIVRSLASANNNRIYVGGYDEFGYVETSETGALIYTDLAGLFRETLNGQLFADIWDIAVTPDGVFFRGMQHLFYWSPKSGDTQFWYWEDRFGAMSYHQDSLYLQFRGEGFRRYTQGDWEPLPASQELTTLIVQLVPLPDGGLLTLARNGDWHRFTPDLVTPYKMSANMPRSSKLTGGVLLDDETLAFSGDIGMLYLYNLKSGNVERVPLGQGFLASLVKSSQGSLLATDDSAFYHVAWPAKWKLMDRLNGLAGSVYAIKEFSGTLYALTGSGVFAKPEQSDTFSRRNWSEHETWDLLELDNGEFLLAESYTIRVVTGEGVSDLIDETIYPRLFLRSAFNPNLIYVGTEFGLALLEQRAAGWQMVYHNTNMQNLRVTGIVETAENEIIIGSERSGLQSISFSQDDSWRAEVTSIGANEGLSYGASSDADVMVTPTGDVLVTTGAGYFKRSGDRYVETLQQLRGFYNSPDLIKLRADSNGNLWGFTYRSVFQQLPNGEWREAKIGNVRQGGINSLHFSEDGYVMVGANASIMLSDPKRTEPSFEQHSVSLRSIETRDASGQSRLLELNRPGSIEQGTSISFSYALPDLVAPESVRYRARLKPIENVFSEWSNSANYTYYNLETADYTLEVEAVDGQGRKSSIEPYNITVEPYWYQLSAVRALGILIGVVLIGLIILGTVRARSRKLAAENQRLESMVTERTRELASANRQLESLAHLDGLTSIPNRRRLDTYLSEVWQQSQERNRTMAIAMLDVDHFKKFNDEHGHPAGDELLKQLAQLLSHSLRRGEDLVARYGGEEFLIVLPGADDEAAYEVAESMRRNVNASELDVTVSLGVATSEKVTFESIEQLIEASDKAVYEAKNRGRNRVVAA
jgi:diguanylate cyclase (GGDEF)-like protein